MRPVRGVIPNPSGQVSFLRFKNSKGSGLGIIVRATPAIETINGIEAFWKILEVGFVNTALFQLLNAQLVLSRAATVAIQCDPVVRSAYRLECNGTCVEASIVVVGGDFAQRVDVGAIVNSQDCVETTACRIDCDRPRVRRCPCPPERVGGVASSVSGFS